MKDSDSTDPKSIHCAQSTSLCLTLLLLVDIQLQKYIPRKRTSQKYCEIKYQFGNSYHPSILHLLKVVPNKISSVSLN